MKKRLVAFTLILTMVWSSTVNFNSGAFTAYAEMTEQEYAEPSSGGTEEGEGLPDPEKQAGEPQGAPEADGLPEFAGDPENEGILPENKDSEKEPMEEGAGEDAAADGESGEDSVEKPAGENLSEEESAESKDSDEESAEDNTAEKEPAEDTNPEEKNLKEEADGEEPAEGEGTGEDAAADGESGEDSVEKPAGENLSEEESAESKDSEEESAEDNTAEKEPAEDTNPEEKTLKEEADGEEPAEGEGAGGDAAADKETGEESAEKPAGETHSEEESAESKDSDEESAADNTAGKEPAEDINPGEESIKEEADGEEPAEGKGAGEDAAADRETGEEPAEKNAKETHSEEESAESKDSDEELTPDNTAEKEPAEGADPEEESIKGKADGEEPAEKTETENGYAEETKTGESPEEAVKGSFTMRRMTLAKGAPAAVTGTEEETAAVTGTEEETAEGTGSGEKTAEGTGTEETATEETKTEESSGEGDKGSFAVLRMTLAKGTPAGGTGSEEKTAEGTSTGESPEGTEKEEEPTEGIKAEEPVLRSMEAGINTAETVNENADTLSAAQVPGPEAEPVRVMLFAAPSAGTNEGTASPETTEPAQVTSAPSTLQSKIESAVSTAMGGRIRIILEKNTIYDGEVNIDKTASAFTGINEVEMDVADAGEDGLQADGSTLFTGVMNLLNGISMIMKGLGLPGIVNVQSGSSLTYFGTRADDGVNVSVSGAGSKAEVHTGEGEDSVSVTAQDAESVSIDTGKGGDTVRAELKGTNAEIQTGDGEDTVNLTLQGAGKTAAIRTGEEADTVTAAADAGSSLTIETEAGKDTVQAVIKGGSTAAIRTGDGDDTVNAEVTADSTAGIQTGEGDDTIGITAAGNGETLAEGKTEFVTVSAGNGDDSVIVAGKGTPSNGTLRIDLGDGANLADVDISVADAANTVAVVGGAGNDRIHATGTLNTNGAAGTAGNIQLTNSNGKTVAITYDAGAIESVTDNLANKAKVEFTDPATQLANNFTDYIYTGSLDNDLLFSGTPNLLLTNVIVKNDDALQVGKNITADGLQLVLLGRTVQVDGTVKAGLVRIEAESGTGVGAPRAPGKIAGSTDDIPISLLNLAHTAAVTINGKVISAGDVLILSKAQQQGGIITLAPDSGLINVKVAKAIVDVNGEIYAGYTENQGAVTPVEGKGSVSILTQVKTTSGVGDSYQDGNGGSYEGLPLAVSLVKADSIINIAETAKIVASDSIRIASETDAEIETRADSGFAGIPAAIAASYVIGDAKSTVAGTLEAGNQVTVSADGNLKVTTLAERGSNAASSSTSGYAALALVLQGVKAEIAPAAKVTAGKDVNVQSDAAEKVYTTAASSAAAGSTEQNPVESMYSYLTGLWGTIKKTLGLGDDDLKEMDAAVSKVTAGGGAAGEAVQLDDKAGMHGQVTFAEDENHQVSVTVKAAAGYRVKSVQWRGLDAGAAGYAPAAALTPDADGKYTFTRDKTYATLFVEYEEDPDYNPDGQAAASGADAFEDGYDQTAESPINVRTLVGNMTGNLSEDGIDKEDRTVKLVLPDGSSDGAILTYETEEDGKCLASVAPGQKLRLVVNPAAGKALQKDSLTAQYTVMDNGQSAVRTAVIQPDDKGGYYLLVPENADPAAGIRISAAYVDAADPQAVIGQAQGMQLAGAAAVGITKNESQAVIAGADDGKAAASVTAGGDVTLLAEAAADVRTLADGTAVTEGTAADPADTSLGAALALTVAESHNKAEIKGSVESAGDVKVQAFGEAGVQTESKAGFSRGATGVGGAVSIQVAKADSKARMFEKSNVKLDGKLSVEAENDVGYSVNADASGNTRTAGETGVGAGIAAAIDTAKTVAAIQDGAALAQKTDGQHIRGITLRADQQVKDSVTAASGASGKDTALAAALAVDSVTTGAEAYLGKIGGQSEDSVLNVDGDVKITAGNTAAHFVQTNGAAAGTKGGYGVAAGFSFIADNAAARLNQSLTAGSLRVNAETESDIRNINIAGAKGGRIPFSLRLRQNRLVLLLDAILEMEVLAGELPRKPVELYWKYRPPTVLVNNMSMGIAGAAGFNFQESESLAEILNQRSIEIGGKARVTAGNRTEAVLKADSSTTNAGMGVGLGAAYNAVTMHNTARIGNGNIKAASLEVSATTKEKTTPTAAPDYSDRTFDVSTDQGKQDLKNYLTEQIGQPVNDYVQDLGREIGLEDFLPGNIVNSIISPVGSEILDEFVNSSGLADMFGTGFIEDVINVIKDNKKTEKWIGIGLLAVALEADAVPFDDFGDGSLGKIVSSFVDGFNEMLVKSIRSSVVNHVGDLFHKKFSFNEIPKDVYEDIKKFIKENLKGTLQEAKKAALDTLYAEGAEAITDKTGQPIDKETLETIINGSIDLFASAKDLYDVIAGLSSEDAAKIKAQAEEAGIKQDETFEDDVEGNVTTALDKIQEKESGKTDSAVSDLDAMIAETIIKAAEQQNVILSDAQIAALKNPYDLALEGKKGSAGTHLVDTQAVSGAGAIGMAISGSAALTNLDFSTTAELGHDKVTVNPDDSKYKVNKGDQKYQVNKKDYQDADGNWNQPDGEAKYNAAVQEKEAEYGKDAAAAFKQLADDLAAAAEENRKINGGTVDVTGDMRFEADGSRFVNNVASAALNGKGSASTNAASADAANADVGDSNSAQTVTEGENFTVTVTKGIQAQIDGTDKKKVLVTVKPGFRLKAADDGVNYAVCSYNDRHSGTEKTEQIKVQTDDQGKLYLDTGSVQGAPADAELHFTLETEEVLKEVILSAPVAGEGVQLPEGAVTVDVKGREAEDGKLFARAGDTIRVEIRKLDGAHLEYIEYAYTDTAGKTHTVAINPDVSVAAGKETQYTLVTADSDSYVFNLRMPNDANDSGVAINTSFIKTEEGSIVPFYSLKDRTTSEFGRSIGLGVSLSLLTGSDSTTVHISDRYDNPEKPTTGLNAGTLTISARADHQEEIYSAAGSNDASVTALDASAAVDALDSSVKAAMNKGNLTNVTGYQSGSVTSAGDLSLTAEENSITNITASAFSVGRGTAVGATTALNLAGYGAEVSMGGAAATGAVTVAASSFSRDTTTAVATAVGQDISVLADKAGLVPDEENPGQVKKQDGSAESGEGNVLTERLDANRNANRNEDDNDSGEDTDASMPISVNALKSQGVTTDVNEEDPDAMDLVNGFVSVAAMGGAAYNTVNNFFYGSKLQLAAAIGLTQAKHTARAKVEGDITTTGGPISITADNNANFAAVGTSATMSLLLQSNSVSGAAAVADNKNEATVTVKGNLKAAGDVTLRSSTIRNLDEDFINKLTAQSVSGAVSGYNGNVTAGMSVSLIKTKATTTTDVNGNIEGGNIAVEATDQSRLAARAGGVSLSLGTAFGAGLANSTILSQDTVTAKVADGKSITGSGFTLNAEKKNVTAEDYAKAIAELNMRGEGAESRINIKTDDRDPEDDKQENSAQIDLYASKLLKLYDKINQFSFQNYYTEAIGASAQLTNSTFSLGGSFTYLKTRNTIETLLGEGVKVTLAKQDGEGKNGDMALSAIDNATHRMVTGGLSVAPATISAGLALALMTNQDTVSAVTGKGSTVNAAGKLTQEASSEMKTEVLTAAASLSASITNNPVKREESGTDEKGNPVPGKPKSTTPDPRSGNAIAGGVNVLFNKATVRSEVGEGTQLAAGADAGITSRMDADLLALVADAAITLGKSGFAGGGSANGIRDEATVRTVLAKGVEMNAGGNAEVGADAASQLIAGVASAVAQATASGLGIAAGVNVNFAGAKAETTLNENAAVRSAGDTDIRANADAWALSGSASLAGAIGTAAGASFNMNTFSREAKVNLAGGTQVDAGGNAQIRAGGNDTSYLAGLVLTGSYSGLSLSGNALVMKEENDIGITAGGTVKGGKNVLMESWLSDKTLAMDGTIALATVSAAAGLTNVYIEKNNKVQTLLEGASLTAGGQGEAIKTRYGKEISGVYAGANVRDSQAVAAASVAVSPVGTGITGGGVEMENNNQVLTRTDTAVLTATAGDIGVMASDYTQQQLLAGGLNFGGSSGIGAALTLLRASKQVEAVTGVMHAGRNIEVLAENEDNLEQLSVSAGAGMLGAAVDVGAAVQLLKSSVKASAAGTIESEKGSFSLTANNDATIYNMAGTAAFSGDGAAATPVATVTLFTGTADARVLKGTKVNAAEDVTIHAESIKDINQYTIGAAVAVGLGLSGAVNLLISKDTAKAVAESQSDLSAGKNLNIEADGSYGLKSRSAAVAASVTGLTTAVNGVVSLLNSNVTAELGGAADAKAGSVNVKADAKHNVSNIVANIAAGSNSAGLSVLILAAGTKLSQDAADMIVYGNADNRDEKIFDYDKVAGLAGNYQKPVAGEDPGNGFADEDLKNAGTGLEGDGHVMSKEGVGTAEKDGNGTKTGSIDVSSGYVSKDFDNGKYDDKGEKMRGEDQEATDSTDVQNARQINTYTYEGEDPSDAVIARITQDAVIREAAGVNVAANQEITADLVGVSIGAGSVGAGISLAAAKLRSHVSASSLGELNKIGSNGITITANSAAGKPGEEAASRDEALAKLTDAVDPSSNGLRVVSGAAGVGSTGLAVSVAMALTDNVTEAVLGGKVNAAGDVKVAAGQNYGSVKALNVAVAAGGSVAAAASAAFAQSQGSVKAEISENTHLQGKNVSVVTDTTVDQTVLSTSASVGTIAVNAGLALAINRMTQDTKVRGGTEIKAASLNVNGKSATAADSYLMGFSVSADPVTPAVLLSAAVSQVNAKINTEVGEQDKAQVKLTLDDALNIHNEVTASAIPLALNVAGGGIAIGGNVLLALNETEAAAKLTNADLTAGSASVTSDLAGTVSASMAKLNAGVAAIGLSVNYADIRARNRAIFENTRAVVSKDLTVRTGAGKDSNRTEAVAETVSGDIGLIAVGLNAAVARNTSLNEATLDSNLEISVGGDLTVHGHGENSTRADVTGLTIAPLTAATGTAVVAMNNADSRTNVKADLLTVRHAAAFDATQKASTKAHALTGNGSLVTVTGNVVLAYGRTHSLINVDLGLRSNLDGAELRATNSASDETASKIENATAAGIAIGAMIGGAYSQDVFDTTVKFGGDFKAGDITVNTGYDISTDTDVTPSLGGIRVDAAELAVNLALAKNTAYAGAQLYAAGGTASAGNVNVIASGSARTNAIVRSAKLTVSGVAIGVDIANANGSMKQAADIELDQATLTAKSVSVASVGKTAETTATVGMTGGASEDEFDIKLVNVDVNWARAKENLDSTAMIRGGSSASSVLNADTLNVMTGMENNGQTKAEAVTSLGVEIGLATGSGLDSRAATGDSFNSVLSGLTANVAGKSNISAIGSTTARAEGTAPGTYTFGLDVNVSNIYAGVGSKDDNQTAMVLIGDDTVLNSGDTLDLWAMNSGFAVTEFVKKTQYTLVGVKVASIPTESWYNTGVLIGSNAKLNASSGSLNVSSDSIAGAKSTIDASSLGLAFDYNSMKGQNSITDRNAIDIGQGTSLTADAGDISILGTTNTRAQAMSKLKGAGVIAGEVVDAANKIDRQMTIYLDKNSMLQTRTGQVTIASISGDEDNIVADSYVKAGGLVAIGEATATNEITSVNQITIDQGVQIFSAMDLNLLARATSRLAKDDANLLEKGSPDDDEALPIDGQKEEEASDEDEEAAQKAMAAHEAERKAKLQEITDASNAAQQESNQYPEKKDAQIEADDSQGYGVYAHATAKAKGAGVKPEASAVNRLHFSSVILFKKPEAGETAAQIQIQSDRGAIHIETNNAGLRAKAESRADGSALGGWSDAWSEISADLQNTIWVDNATLQSRVASGITLLAWNGQDSERPYLYAKADAASFALLCSANADAVISGSSFNQIRSTDTNTVSVRGQFTHTAVHPSDAIHYTLDSRYEKLASSGKDSESFSWGAAKHRCDFCGEGQGNTIDPNAYRADKQGAFSKALSPLNDILAATAKLNGITKARYGEEDYIAAGRIYTLDLQVLLTRDVRLEEDKLREYRLWTNGRTFQEVLLLPNSSRLYTSAEYKVEYIADVLYGDVLGNGENQYADIITALTKRAFDEPVIPVGSTGSLDMKTGVLTLPSMSDYELYMHEVSAAWMMEKLTEGYICILSADQEEINAVALTEGDTLPEGTIVGGITEDGEAEGWTRFWLGLTPETAPNGETPLYFMLVNRETDEMKIFRTSGNMMAEGAEPVAESMYLYRDSDSDMNGEEKYHCMLFDTPEGQKSIIKIVTNILEDWDIVLPLAIRITLRSFTLEGADLPAYSLGDHILAMCDGTDGTVSLLGGFYEAVFDGDIFESSYVRIENIREGKPVVTIRKDQEIWAEPEDENKAFDIAGNEYVCIDGVWYPVEEAPATAM